MNAKQRRTAHRKIIMMAKVAGVETAPRMSCRRLKQLIREANNRLAAGARRMRP